MISIVVFHIRETYPMNYKGQARHGHDFIFNLFYVYSFHDRFDDCFATCHIFNEKFYIVEIYEIMMALTLHILSAHHACLHR